MPANPTNKPRSDVLTGTGARFAALDGLRGISAVVVVLCHALLVTPGYSASYGIGSHRVSGWAWLVTYTPLHIFWAGTEAVYLFFVLSGFVLALSFTGARSPSWKGYYPRRLLRLYLPVWASVGFAVLTFIIVHHRTSRDFSGWLNIHASAISKVGVARDMSLLVRPGVYASQLWSLKWEVVFSLLLPIFLAVSRRMGDRCWWLQIALLLAVSAVGHIVNVFALLYLPMFGIGVAMVAALGRLRQLALRLSRFQWTVLVGVSLLSLTFKWYVTGIFGAQASVSWPLDVVAVIGGVIMVFVFSFNRTAIRFGGSRGIAWTGRRSFSLYLVHEPVIVTIAMLFSSNNGWVVLPVALPVTAVVTAIFFAVVERPSHRLANRIGRSVERGARIRRTSVNNA